MRRGERIFCRDQTDGTSTRVSKGGGVGLEFTSVQMVEMYHFAIEFESV